MSRQFSIFTKGIAFVVVVAVCVAMLPSEVFAGPCDSERSTMRKTYIALIAICGTAGWRCAMAILAPNPVTVGLCVFGIVGCGGIVWAYVDAARAYKKCMNRSGVAVLPVVPQRQTIS